MKTTHEIVPGITVEMIPRTISSLIQAEALENEYRASDNIVTNAVADLCTFATITFTDKTSGIIIAKDCKLQFLNELKAFLKLIKSDAPTSEWIDYYCNNIPLPFHNAWVKAFDASNAAITTPEEKPGHLLTDEERADPN